jgi:integrase/recombinase XerD
MMERSAVMVKVPCPVVVGPLAGYAPDFAVDLCRQGYTYLGRVQQFRVVAHLSRWMLECGVEASGLSGEVVDRYIAVRRACGYRNSVSALCLGPLLGYLSGLGVLAPPVAVAAVGPVEQLLQRYRRFLIEQRGFRAGTAGAYLDLVRPFVDGFVCDDGLVLSAMTAADVTGFVLAVCPTRPASSAKLVVTALRSLLGWLHVSGQVPLALAGAVPAVAGWRSSGLPRGLEPGQLRRLLNACDRRRSAGRRDYAILLLLSRLGLRVGEVAALTLDDVDWRRGEITVRGKGERIERLPLPADVGAAISGYLRRGRPGTALGRALFVRIVAPHREMSGAAVSDVVVRVAHRAGLDGVCAHRLRHTAATAMLRAGASLPEVGQVLRHRSMGSTAIYAKVDDEALRVLVRAWPVAVPAPARVGGGAS